MELFINLVLAWVLVLIITDMVAGPAGRLSRSIAKRV
jgi:hypothetical protein